MSESGGSDQPKKEEMGWYLDAKLSEINEKIRQLPDKQLRTAYQERRRDLIRRIYDATAPVYATDEATPTHMTPESQQEMTNEASTEQNAEKTIRSKRELLQTIIKKSILPHKVQSVLAGLIVTGGLVGIGVHETQGHASPVDSTHITPSASILHSPITQETSTTTPTFTPTVIPSQERQPVAQPTVEPIHIATQLPPSEVSAPKHEVHTDEATVRTHLQELMPASSNLPTISPSASHHSPDDVSLPSAHLASVSESGKSALTPTITAPTSAPNEGRRVQSILQKMGQRFKGMFRTSAPVGHAETPIPALGDQPNHLFDTYQLNDKDNSYWAALHDKYGFDDTLSGLVISWEQFNNKQSNQDFNINKLPVGYTINLNKLPVEQKQLLEKYLKDPNKKEIIQEIYNYNLAHNIPSAS